MEDQNNTINNENVDATSTEQTGESETTERRPISDAKLAANRANAQKSTGPKDPILKKKVSMNALRHGLTSARAYQPGDSLEDYDYLIQSHFERYAPETDQETELVQTISENAWRILKVAPEEAAIYDIGRLKYGTELFPEIKDPDRRLGLINAQVGILYEKQLKNVRLHERRLRNQQEKDIFNLNQMQSNRIARIAREQKEAADAEEAHLSKARRIVKNCAEQNKPCVLASFGFVFSVDELNAVDREIFAYYRLTGDNLNFYDVLNRIREQAA